MHRWMRPLARFLQIETASGGVLLLCAVAALLVANSGASSLYHAVWEFPIEIHVGGLALSHSLAEWVNDGLMTIFFFVVGLEIKREILFGELRDPRKAALPIAAAAGGMAVPAAIYLSLQWGEPGARGWGIPMATRCGGFVRRFLPRSQTTDGPCVFRSTGLPIWRASSGRRSASSRS